MLTENSSGRSGEMKCSRAAAAAEAVMDCSKAAAVAASGALKCSAAGDEQQLESFYEVCKAAALVVWNT